MNPVLKGLFLVLFCIFGWIETFDIPEESTSPFELEADQKNVFETFMEAARKLDDAGIHLVGWNGGEFDVVNTRKLEWGVFNVHDKYEDFNLLYPHQNNEITDLKNITIPGITAGYYEDNHGIRCKLKK